MFGRRRAPPTNAAAGTGIAHGFAFLSSTTPAAPQNPEDWLGQRLSYRLEAVCAERPSRSLPIITRLRDCTFYWRDFLAECVFKTLWGAKDVGAPIGGMLSKTWSKDRWIKWSTDPCKVISPSALREAHAKTAPRHMAASRTDVIFSGFKVSPARYRRFVKRG
jgi:hypothetical protein